jgi:hypothetical protein
VLPNIDLLSAALMLCGIVELMGNTLKSWLGFCRENNYFGASAR